ncbi:M56 family metallopeptidase [Flavobacterium aestivum]|uniref:M56 family metallopeptidase n=1 Tax=Flavobacterium aestivum TaxID=3003257 RepID=UPI0024828644|nr:M56 family metallopeptidase [Flavobacterium aestivum]
METLFIYIAKSSGLIAMFYIAYYLFLRKETFFTANRWFLLAGLLTSVILPWVVFTTIVWVEPTTTHYDWSKMPMTTRVQKESFEINWYLVLAIAYIIGIALFLTQFAFDFYSLNRVLKGKTIHQQADHKFIDLKENIAPFSYFNTIVYNSSMYSKAELESILEHEKVHSDQYHTVDVLITRLFCTLFWFNPFIWLYKNAILQNLEFIADSEATKNISDKKAYQLTLLKITTHENCVVLTNHFYQSLIKKRIVMLNKNQSKKWNSWKYALVLPVLVAFVFLFQIKTIAQEKIAIQKEINKNQSDPEATTVYNIKKSTTDLELQETAKILSEKHAINATFSKVKRNSDKELIGLKVKLQKGKEIATVMEVNSSEPIKDFGIAISKNENGTTNIGIVTDKKGMRTTNRRSYDSNEPIPPVDPIAAIDPVDPVDPALPALPAPPVFPDGPMPKFPEIDMSKMPKPPVHPADVNDKKAMKQFNKEMKEFEAKMEAFEPDSQAFEQAIEEEMERRQAIFEKQMEKYEIAMEARRDAMEARREAMEAKREAMEARKEAMREHEKE